MTAPPFVHRLEDFVRGAGPPSFAPVDNAALSFIAALCSRALADAESGSRVWLTHANPRVRDRIAVELDLWNIRPLLLPDLPESEDDQLSIPPETIAERLDVMNVLSSAPVGNKSQVVILSPDALDAPSPSPETLRESAQAIHLGDDLDPDLLEKRLLDHGYERVTQVHAHGQVARRGGIMDLFSWHAAAPLRMEFFDTEIDSLREFDIDTQVSTRKVKTAEITIAEPEQTATVRDYIRPNDRWLAAGDEETPADAHAYIRQAGDSESICPGTPLGVFDAGDFILNETRRHRFFQQIADWRQDHWQIFLTFANQGERSRFEELVDQDFFTSGAITPLAGDLVQGFTVPAAKLAFLSSAELFGRYQTPQTRKRASRIDHQRRARQQTALEDISKGDLVVHTEYGVGRFQGIDRDEDGHEEIHIRYRDGAILSVPLDHSHLLSKYVGLGGKDPELNRLGTAAWTKAKHSAEKSILDYAAKLLQMQAERNTQPGYCHPPDSRWMWEFENSFHHTITAGQRDAIEDMKADMESPKPMDRLICGDVGFGKTEVAIRAAFKAVTGGKQAAVLVPTTVLAEQHWRTFRERMSDYPVRIELLNRFRSTREVKETLKGLADGSVDIVIGTHRLISKDVNYKDLGVAIVDEEQRFGVKHKERFKEMFRNIDVLTLSATPIPRTLYLSLMGARDMSTIDTPLPGKVPINTSIHGYDQRIIRDAIRRELKRGGQVFFLHNRVQSIDVVQAGLKKLVPEASIVVGHGQMEKDELEVVMRSFVSGEADILLATTIIESGIDIPNANTIIIDRADRFGLADLYQLRGRVGRAGGQAYAVLLLPSDLIQGDARKRINAIQQYTALGSGFKIAMRDLEIRGAGNLLGTKQSGHIAAVGFDLYCQLLRQSIDRLRDGKITERVDVTFRADFICFSEAEYIQASGDETGDDRIGNLPAYLPASYMPEARLRISAYKELAELVTQKELKNLKTRWIDRFGRPPESTANLLTATAVKLAAAAAGISTVEIREQRLMLTRNGEYIFLTGKRFPRLKSITPEEKLAETLEMLRSI
ncbi:transcription-repair coupling factor [Verrucomicrobiaceae bacterium 5K15]|uniref:Transcription-repair-coupling factor n=1 Tax=Oceaniferula flava TaxID=2800421 RepID=A0AAE2V864_9BACT|nr:transcription-repair coupling factor [Oceaniferula flavus]MBM1136333.1 transcription-repair coupling factor [Oceaniferula flavus]